MKYAEVIEKRTWHDGQFPDPEDGKPYKTRQIVFRTDDGKRIHVNVKDKNKNSMKFNELKVGDKICEFTMLKGGNIINPDSKFTMYSKNALF
jgi:hypothetical protein